MVEVNAGLELTGPDGSVTLLDAFEGRRQLIAWHYSSHAPPTREHAGYACGGSRRGYGVLVLGRPRDGAGRVERQFGRGDRPCGWRTRRGCGCRAEAARSV